MILALTFSANYAQEFTFTTSTANITSSMARIDKIGLANNPDAIIVATPLYDPIKTTQRSLGVWYYNNQWYFFNTDQSRMREGLSFKMQIFLSPSNNAFLHIISTQNLAGGFSVIDNPQLNNNPNAVVTILQNHAPDIRMPYKLNPDEAQAIYDAPTGKWYIQNVNGNPLSIYTAYNVVISGGAIGVNTNTRVEKAIPKNPTSISPTQTTRNTGNAGGDLSGTYPDPNVKGLLGRPLSDSPPQIGQILTWTGNEWAPANDETGISSEAPRYNAGAGLSLNGPTFSAQNTASMWNADQIAGGKISTTPPTIGQVLKWNGNEWAPADVNVPTTPTTPVPPIETHFKKVSLSSPENNPEPELSDSNPTQDLTGLALSIPLKKKSILVISVSIMLTGPHCPFVTGCNTDGSGQLTILINKNQAASSNTNFAVSPYTSTTLNISNYMQELGPGTHSIEFKVVHGSGYGVFSLKQLFSSVMVIPLE